MMRHDCERAGLPERRDGHRGLTALPLSLRLGTAASFCTNNTFLKNPYTIQPHIFLHYEGTPTHLGSGAAAACSRATALRSSVINASASARS